MDNPMAQFCILYENSFKDALKKVKKWIQDKKYIPSHSHFPIENGNFQNGMPRFSETFIMADDPKNYSAIFSWQENQINQIYYKEIRGFSQLCQYIRNNDFLNKKLNPLDYNRLNDFFIFSALTNMVEKYIYEYNSTNFSKNRFKKISIKFFNYLSTSSAEIEIYVPILFINFNFDKLIIDEKTEIIKMDSLFQLSRQKISNYGSSVHKTVMGCATHCLLFKNYYLNYGDSLFTNNSMETINCYPLDKINKFFSAIRINNLIDTGYAQLISRLVNIDDGYYTANLLELKGTSLRNYPTNFDDYGWNKDIPTLNIEDCNKIKEIYLKLLDSNDKKIELAIDRINRGFLRDNEEDLFIDMLIGMESLLTDSSKSSINYKLSLRLTYLLSRSNIKIYHYNNIISKLYDYRSAIIHGSKDKERKKTFSISGINYNCIETSKKIFCESLKYILLQISPQSIKELPSFLDKKIIECIVDTNC